MSTPPPARPGPPPGISADPADPPTVEMWLPPQGPPPTWFDLILPPDQHRKEKPMTTSRILTILLIVLAVLAIIWLLIALL